MPGTIEGFSQNGQLDVHASMVTSSFRQQEVVVLDWCLGEM